MYINHAEGEEGIDQDGNPAFYTSELFRQVRRCSSSFSIHSACLVVCRHFGSDTSPVACGRTNA